MSLDPAAPDLRSRNVTFTWTETEPDHPALDVLVRLIALTDYAQDDGDLEPLSARPRPREGGWTGSLDVPSDLRTSYQLCPVRDEPLARPVPPTTTAGLEILAMGDRRRDEPVDARGVVHLWQRWSCIDSRTARGPRSTLAGAASGRALVEPSRATSWALTAMSRHWSLSTHHPTIGPMARRIRSPCCSTEGAG